MQLAGDLTAISIADLITLLDRSEWEGTLRVRRDGETALFVLQGGLVLFPLPRPRVSRKASGAQLKRRRQRDELRANRRMVEVTRWERGSFRCFAGQVPKGFVARRTLVVRVERLQRHCGVPTRGPSWGWEAAVGLQGTVAGRDLPDLARLFVQSHLSGVLSVRSARASLEVLIHGRTTYMRRLRRGERPLLIGPAETLTITWKPRPVPEVGLTGERFQRVALFRDRPSSDRPGAPPEAARQREVPQRTGLRPETFVRANLSGRGRLQVA